MVGARDYTGSRPNQCGSLIARTGLFIMSKIDEPARRLGHCYTRVKSQESRILRVPYAVVAKDALKVLDLRR